MPLSKVEIMNNFKKNNSNMKYIKSLFGFFIVAILFTQISCTKDFEEMNKNPHGFTTSSDGSLFNNIISSLRPGWNEMFYINNEVLYKQTQLAALSQASWGNYEIGTEEIWSRYYKSLPEVRELQSRFESTETSAELLNMQAMLKIVLAYKTFTVTDLFGDIPFSNAGYGFQNLEYLHPKFDKQEDIYKFLLNELKWADENIDETATSLEPFLTFKAFDPLFNGDMEKWRKFANSLSLRYAMRMAEKDEAFAGEIIKNIIENERPVLVGYNLASEVLESACMFPSATGFSNNGVEWAFREHNNLRMGSNVWHQLSKTDSTNGSGIFDLRAYIFFDTNNESEWAPFPQLPESGTPISGGIPYGSQRDNEGAYNVKGSTCIYSPINYYLVRDSDFIPIIFMTSAEVHFIKAEAYLRGIGVAQDEGEASNEYMSGINTSVEWWKQTAENSKLPSSGVTFEENITIPSTLSASSVVTEFGLWNATTEEEKLIFLYTQRWLDSFWQPMEAFALTRRTGKTPHEGDPIDYFRFPYPPSEMSYNQANCVEAVSRQGGDSPQNKFWWIP